MSKVVENALPSAVLRRGEDRCAEGGRAALAGDWRDGHGGVRARLPDGEDGMRSDTAGYALVEAGFNF